MSEPYVEGSSSSSPASATPPPSVPAPASPPPPPPVQDTAPSGAASSTGAPLVYSYPTGQWVYTVGQGWVWVPADATPVQNEGVPYVYLYTPAYGWTWYVSPWGWGPYRYGAWYRHPWHPVGMHGYWVARPRVVVRLGSGRRR
jgi:hypothetical protein